MSDKHTLKENFDPLAQLDYLPLLDEILKELKTNNFRIFQLSPQQDRLLI